MELPRTTITLIRDRDTDHYHVSVTIGADEHVLGVYSTATDAGRRMRSWVDGRGLRFAPDSAARFDRAERADADMLVLDVIA